MPRGSEYSEFKLKLNASSVADLQHHVLVLNSASVGMSDLTTPIRLARQSDQVMLVDDNHLEDNEDLVDPSSRRFGRRKSRIISAERKKRLEEEQEQKDEAAPWVLEDADSQHTFIGKLEGGQQSNYVFFVNQGRDFLVVPASKWYRFNPKPVKTPFTIEEAEAQMARPGKERLALTQQLQKSRQLSPVNEAADSQPTGQVPKLRALRETMMNETQATAGLGHYGKGLPSSVTPPALHEEIDYNEVFDDDVGEDDSAAPVDEDDPSAPKPTVRLSYFSQKLSAAGRDLGKLVHSLDRKIVDYRVSDEERDPYADFDEDGDADNDDDEDPISDASSVRSAQPPAQTARLPPHLGGEAGRQLSRPASLPLLSNSSVQQRPVSSTLNSPEKKARGMKRSLSDEEPKAAPSSQPQLSASEPPAISTMDIVGLLRKGPMKTKDIIQSLRDKLKSDSAKDSFKDIIKRVAIVRSTEKDEKWLELKPEFV